MRSKTWQRKHLDDLTVLCIIELRKRLGWTDMPADLVQFVYRGCPYKVIYSKFDNLADKGYLTCGVSMNYPFLTREGEEFLMGHQIVEEFDAVEESRATYGCS